MTKEKEIRKFYNLIDFVGWVGVNWDNIQEYKEFADQENMVEFTMYDGKKLVAII